MKVSRVVDWPTCSGRRHGEGVVGDLVAGLVWLQVYGRGRTPLVALGDGRDAARLVGRVGHGHRLGARAAHWTDEGHHLEGDTPLSLKQDSLENRKTTLD